jgi:TPR repeat protein
MSMLRRLWCWNLIALSLMVTSAASAGPFEDALAAYKRKDYATAASLFRSLAEAGDARAQGNLGVMYTYGQGVPQDYDEALKWYRRGAEQGDPRAQYNLAVRYERGGGSSRTTPRRSNGIASRQPRGMSWRTAILVRCT